MKKIMCTRSIRLLFTLVLVGCALPVWAQSACDEVRLDEAALFYDLGRFDDAEAMLRPCLPGRIRRGDQRFGKRASATRALRLMALASYARREPPDSTSQWVRRLVTLDRRYRADPEEDPLFFQYLVEELRPPRWYQRRWVQAGGVLLVGGLVGCLLGGCFEKTIDPLPGPPSDPPRGF